MSVTRKSMFAIALSVLSVFAYSQSHMHHHMETDSHWSHQALKSGDWNDPSTWQDGIIPGDDASVWLPAGITVTLARQNSVSLGQVLVEGSLIFQEDVNTRLITDTLNVALGGRLQIGTAQSPVSPQVTAEVVFRDRQSVPFNSNQSNLGLMASGEVVIYGAEKLSRKTLKRDAIAGKNRIRLAGGQRGNWQAGDELLITATNFRQGATLQNEVRKLVGWKRKFLAQLDTPLDFSHIRAANGQMPVWVANLTRNVVFRSDTPQSLTSRGHVMFMPSSDVDINFASFIGLGRTDKERITRNDNPQGRYAFHFHRNGLDKVQKVNGIVVRGTPGWGVVNHSSYVDIRNSIVHDFKGAAFVTEAGDELGSFVGNLAAGGTLRPTHRYPHSRHAFGQRMNRFRVGDLGFSGIGFWLAGPKVDLINNVVAGSRGAAYFYFSMGNYEPGNNGSTMTGMPMDRVEPGIKVARWAHANQFALASQRIAGNMAVSSYLGTGQFRGNHAYGVYQGLRLRWTGHHAGQIIRDLPQVGRSRIDGGLRYRRNRSLYGTSELINSRFWNVEEGISITYSGKVTVRDMQVFNDISAGQSIGTAAARASVGNLEGPIHLEDITFSDFGSGISRRCSVKLSNVQMIRINNKPECGTR